MRVCVCAYTVYVAENMFYSDSCLFFLSRFECERVHLSSPTFVKKIFDLSKHVMRKQTTNNQPKNFVRSL